MDNKRQTFLLLDQTSVAQQAVVDYCLSRDNHFFFSTRFLLFVVMYLIKYGGDFDDDQLLLRRSLSTVAYPPTHARAAAYTAKLLLLLPPPHKTTTPFSPNIFDPFTTTLRGKASNGNMTCEEQPQKSNNK